MESLDDEGVVLRVGEVAARHGDDPHRLVQILRDVQAALHHVPAAALDGLAQRLGLARVQVEGVATFYSHLSATARGHYHFLFSDGYTDRMLGREALVEQLCAALGVERGVPSADGRVTIEDTACTGLCDQGPAGLVNGRPLSGLGPMRIETIAGLVKLGVPVDEWPQELFDVADNIHRRDLLLAGPIQSGDGVRAVLERGAEATLAEVERAGLRGRGGAGFPTARKWGFCRQAEADERVVACNADEGEPGTFKDRVLLHTQPDLVFEGMTVCARVIGARRGLVYLRGEYAFLREPLEAVLAERRRQGLLGKAILGAEGFDFDIEIHLGAGAYNCGEESAMIESLEGHRGTPRIRPPFPVVSGYLGLPTVVDNVESFAAAGAIAAHGGDWFCACGTAESTGTKLLSVAGDCARPGIYEFPFGVTVAEVLEACGGSGARAVQVGGPSGTCIGQTEFSRRIAFEDLATGGAFTVFGPGRDMVEVALHHSRFFAHESCGFCTPCRVGTSVLAQGLERIARGGAGRADLEPLKQLSGVMRSMSHCGLGMTAANPFMQTLERFPEDYEERLAGDDVMPAFDLDAALAEARALSGRDDAHAHLEQRHG